MGRIREKDEIERGGADSVVQALGTLRAERKDHGRGEQIRDFDIWFDDGHAEPLEITLDAQEAVVRTWDRLDRANALQADLSRAWMASPGLYDKDGVGRLLDVQAVRDFLVRFLREVERLGIYEFRTHDLWFHPTLGPAARLLSGYGIHHAGSVEIPSEHADIPRLHLASTHGGWVASSLITKAVEAQAAKADNQAKLAACSSAPRRHLYVGLTSAGESESMAFWALVDLLEGDGEMPPLPVLPEAITTVWASAGSGGIWVTPPGSWHVFPPLGRGPA